MNKESPVTIVNNLAQQFHLHFRVTVRLSSPGVYKSVLSIRNSSFFALSRNEKNAKRLSAVKALIYANKESLPLDYFRRLKILTNEIGKEIEIKVIQNVKNNVCVRINLLGFRCFYGRGSNYGEALENTAFNVMKYPNSWFNDLFQEENSLSLLLKEKEKPDKNDNNRDIVGLISFPPSSKEATIVDQLKTFTKGKVSFQDYHVVGGTKGIICRSGGFEIRGTGKSHQEAKENAAKKMFKQLSEKAAEYFKMKEKDKKIEDLQAQVQELKLAVAMKERKLKNHLLSKTVTTDEGEEQIVDYLSSFVENFEDITYIGCGGFAVVFKGKNKMENKYYAIKRISIPRCEETRMKCLRESQTLAKLNHPSIVRYSTSWWEAPPKHWQKKCDKLWYPEDCSTPSWAQPPDWQVFSQSSGINSEEIIEGSTELDLFGSCSCSPKKACLRKPPVYLYIQMELCEQTLKDWLKKREKVAPKSSYKIFIQILEAVIYFHSQGMIHRDLKPGNIFLSRHGPNQDIKVGDFGLATEVSMENEDLSTSYTKHYHTKDVGTELYKAPEQKSGRHYDKKVDIYGLGVIFFELFHHMGTESERFKVIGNLKNKVFPDDVPEFQRDVIQELMSDDPSVRPSAHEIMKRKSFLDFTNEVLKPVVTDNNVGR